VSLREAPQRRLDVRQPALLAVVEGRQRLLSDQVGGDGGLLPPAAGAALGLAQRALRLGVRPQGLQQPDAFGPQRPPQRLLGPGRARRRRR
jgi:hypothetical protein